MRKSLGLVLIGSLIAITACGGREQSAEPRTKNAALAGSGELLRNISFGANQPGWLTSSGTILGRGCHDRTSQDRLEPSLSFSPGSVTFGRRPSKISQNIVIASPSDLTFTVSHTDTTRIGVGSFLVLLQSASEVKTTTHRLTGDDLAPKDPSLAVLSVTTKTPNEMVTVAISGNGGSFGLGCLGPNFKNPSLTAKPAVPPTTTTSTSTTLPPTTTLPPAPPCSADGRCAVGNRGPGTGLVYFVDPNQPAFYNRYFEVAPPGWNRGSANDPTLTFNDALKAVEAGVTTRTGSVIPARFYSTSELDWRVPTKPELQAVYDSKVDRSLTGEYLTITPGSLKDPIYQYLNFDTGQWRNAPATDAAKVRPVRRGPSPCALGGPCKIGDTGPMGGKVFYATTKLTPIATGKQPCMTDWNPCLYMELAPAGWSGSATDPVKQWANPKGCCVQIAGGAAAGTGIGAGAKNTDAIMLQQQSYDSAAKTAFMGNGNVSDYGKWYLPSNEEARLVCLSKDKVGAPLSGLYWTSTENYQNAAFTVDFSDSAVQKCDISGMSYKDGLGQHSGRAVRPVRAFAPACVPFVFPTPNSADIVDRLVTDPCLRID